MSAENWLRRIKADLAMSAPEEVARHVPAPPPDPPARPAEAPRKPEPERTWYVALARRGDVLVPVGSVTAVEEQAWRDADWWSLNDVPGAFVCELREVTR